MRVLICCFVVMNIFACGQASTPAAADQATPSAHEQMNMPGMNMDMSQPAPDWMPSAHVSSGTGWQPAAIVPHAWMKMNTAAGWDFMAHGVIFVDYNQQGGPRGEGKAESVNWAMLMEQHQLAGGTILFREMFSAESLTSPHPGFPEIFQTGETYHGQPLIDHQHPHNVFSELALDYTHLVADKISWLFYGARRGRTGIRSGRLCTPSVGGRVAHGAALPPSARLHPHQLWRAHGRISNFPIQTRRLSLQRHASPEKNATKSISRRSIPGQRALASPHRATGPRNTAMDAWSIPKRSKPAANAARPLPSNTFARSPPACWQMDRGQPR